MENSKKYLPRLIDQTVTKYLNTFGAVVIEGPKWCGKTMTAEHHSKSAIYLGDPSGNFANRQLATVAPKTILNGDTPRLIDEWQEVPGIWDATRFEVDQRQANGQFILTGSSTPQRKGILHSGAGRIAKIRMRPMSLWESQDSSGHASLKAIFEGAQEAQLTGDVDLMHLIHVILRGGWPGAIGTDKSTATLRAKAYLNAIIDDDAGRIDGVARNTAKLRFLLRSLARNESTTVSVKTLVRDILTVDQEAMAETTVTSYLNVLERLYLLDNQPPFATKLRSSVRLKQREKRHLCDPSLAAALLEATPERLLSDLETLGFLFQALCVRDLRIYGETIGADLYHYQDYKNREADAVLALEDGSWCAVEIKLGAHQIDKASENLLELQRSLTEDECGTPPKHLIVICGMSNAVYQRPDGVWVVPITALKD